jgi:hypothetical protein
LLASIDEEYRNIATSTAGIVRLLTKGVALFLQSNKRQVFMGTPHRGSGLADWGSILAGIAEVMFLRPKRQFLADLKHNSKALSDISEDFIKSVARYSIKSFYEEDKLSGLAIVRSLFRTLHFPALTQTGG